MTRIITNSIICAVCGKRNQVTKVYSWHSRDIPFLLKSGLMDHSGKIVDESIQFCKFCGYQHTPLNKLINKRNYFV